MGQWRQFPASGSGGSGSPCSKPNETSIARATTGSSSAGGGSATDSVVDAVLRAMREENEHLGILDGIDPLF